jgi:hypothetical protein
MRTDLCDWGLRRTNDTEERTQDAKEREDTNTQSGRSLWLRLDGQDGVNLSELDEREDGLANERDRVLPERLIRSLVIVVLSGQVGLLALLHILLNMEGFLGECLGVFNGVTNVDVIEEDILSHGPQFDTDTADLPEALGWLLIVEVGGIGNLAWGPFTLVGWVVDHRCVPFALVVRVGLGRSLPFTATGSRFALGILDGGRNPVTIFLIVPFFGLDCVRIGNAGGLVHQPIVGYFGVLVRDLVRCVLIPISGLRRLRIGNLCFVNPVGRLGVVRVIDFRRRVHGWFEVLEQGARSDFLVINEFNKGLIRVDNESIELGGLSNSGHMSGLVVFLLEFTSNGVSVTENEVDLETK